jgi:predicted ATPase
MAFSSFDRRLLEEGPDYFSRPRLATLLELLGASEGERVAVLATMLRHASPDEFEEVVEVFERAVAVVLKEQKRNGLDEDEPRRRHSRAAERRQQRRRSG